MAALLLLAVSGLTGCNKIKSKQEIKRGNEFLKAAQYQSALAAYEEALRLDPKDTTWSVFAGYQFNRHLAVETAYSDFGEVQTSATLFGAPITATIRAKAGGTQCRTTFASISCISCHILTCLKT